MPGANHETTTQKNFGNIKISRQGKHRIYRSDCRGMLSALPSDSCDSMISDFPYELAFMNKSWDSTGIAFDPEMWAEIYRVLKPGAYAVVFGSTRLFHHAAVAAETAGFEIVECISYLHAKGQPHSLDIAKLVDKKLGVEHDVVGYRKGMSGSGFGNTGHGKKCVDVPVTRAASREAQAFQGQGTGLRPVVEPIIIARKPFAGTLVDNVLRHGTGGIGIDSARFGVSDFQESTRWEPGCEQHQVQGKWPTTFVYAHTEHCRKTAAGVACVPGCPERELDRYQNHPQGFFFGAKPARRERELGVTGGNPHATVKPISLMRHLIALYCPPQGLILEPFAGSGTTVVAAELENRRCVASELSPEYWDIAQQRVSYAVEHPQEFEFTDFRDKLKPKGKGR